MATYADGTVVRRLRRDEMCPVCNHNDYCGVTIPGDDPTKTLYTCQRVRGQYQKKDIIMSGGLEYIVIRSDPDKSTLVEELTEYKSHHRKFEGGAAVASSYQKKEMVYEERVEPLQPEKLDEMYRYFLSLLRLEEKDRKYLEGEGFTQEMIDLNYFRSIPEDDGYRINNRDYKSINPWRKQLGAQMFKQFGDLTGLPGFHQNYRGEWTFCGLGGMVIPLFDIYDHVYGLRVRLDRRWSDAKGNDITKERYMLLKETDPSLVRPERGKYMNFSSYKEDESKLKQGIVANKYRNGCQLGTRLGYYQPTTTGNDRVQKVVFITEGEKKSIVTAEKMGLMCISVPGVTSFRLLFERDMTGRRPIDVLKKAGVKLLVVAYDADKEHNQMVMRSQDSLVNEILAEGINVAVAFWNEQDGKGLDDLLVNGGKPQYNLIATVGATV